MNTKNTDREKISALADNELGEGEVGAALSALSHPDGRAAWDDYHRIGDILRSEDLAIEMSAGFSSKLASRLADEPAIVASAAPQGSIKTNIRRFALPGAAAAAAVAAAAWMAAPQLLVASKEATTSEPPSVSVASASVSLPVSQQAVPVAAANQEMVRDSRLDAYLLAHQRFSPALYSTAQYARSATFAAEGDK